MFASMSAALDLQESVGGLCCCSLRLKPRLQQHAYNSPISFAMTLCRCRYTGEVPVMETHLEHHISAGVVSSHHAATTRVRSLLRFAHTQFRPYLERLSACAQ